MSGLDKDWEDVIQVSDRFENTGVALKKDGTVVYGKTDRENKIETVTVYSDGSVIEGGVKEDSSGSDEWLTIVDSWDKIVKLDWRIKRVYHMGHLETAILVGLDSEGKVHYTTYEYTHYTMEYFNAYIEHKTEMKAFLDALSDISDIQVSETYIAAKDKAGIMHVFSFADGTTFEMGNISVLDSDQDYAYVLDEKNVVKKLNSNVKILEGVIYLDDAFCVTQSGTIYKCNGNETGGKTEVWDTWLER